MLSVTSYPQAYIDDRRAATAAQLETYDALVATADAVAVDAFAPGFCAPLVLALDMDFCHRARGQEGKDGNPMNEVRLLTRAITEHGGVLPADKQIKLKPETSVLGLTSGDEVVLDRESFGRLADAYFDAIAGSFGP